MTSRVGLAACIASRGLFTLEYFRVTNDASCSAERELARTRLVRGITSQLQEFSSSSFLLSSFSSEHFLSPWHSTPGVLRMSLPLAWLVCLPFFLLFSAAVVGWILVDKGLRFPGAQYAAISQSVDAHDPMVASGNMTVLLLMVFLLEMVGGAAIFGAASGSGRQPGLFLGVLAHARRARVSACDALRSGASSVRFRSRW